MIITLYLPRRSATKPGSVRPNIETALRTATKYPARFALIPLDSAESIMKLNGKNMPKKKAKLARTVNKKGTSRRGLMIFMIFQGLTYINRPRIRNANVAIVLLYEYSVKAYELNS